jgi:hypothetical protein
MKRDSDDAAADRADRMVGPMNVYSDANGAPDEWAERLGELFAVPAVGAVHNAQILEQTQRLAAQFRSALIDQAVIDQAIGILRSRDGVSAEEAVDLLRVASERDQARVPVVADGVVREAIRRVQYWQADKI